MLTLTNLRARSLDLQSMMVAWDVVPTADDVLDYRFQVLKSESSGGPWDPASDWFIDKYVFRDSLVRPFHLHRQLNYKIRVKHAPTDQTEDYGPFSPANQPDLVALEVRRHWEVVLHELTGRRSWLFPVRTFGSYCKNCYSPTTQMSINAKCKSCYGTGYARGYMQPMEVWAQYVATPKQMILTPTIQQESPTTVYMPAFPESKPKDLLIGHDNRRWRVAAVKMSERLGAVLHQELAVVECARGDIEYEVPVNFDDLLNAPIAAVRNFKYRTCLE